jgi:hypothetical protein
MTVGRMIRWSGKDLAFLRFRWWSLRLSFPNGALWQVVPAHLERGKL